MVYHGNFGQVQKGTAIKNDTNLNVETLVFVCQD